MTRKTKNILASLTLAASIAASAVPAFAFTDVSDSHWANEAITALSAGGYVNGYTDGSFGPDNKITRAEYVTIINNIKGNVAVSAKKFSDLSADAWYYSAINSAVAKGYIGGYADGTVKPDACLTRAEAAVIAYRAWELDPEGTITFADGASIGDWASSQIATLVAKNIIGGYGDNTFRPSETITRAEVAKILYRLMEMEKNVATTESDEPKSVGIGSVIIKGGSGGSSSKNNNNDEQEDEPTLDTDDVENVTNAANTIVSEDATEAEVAKAIKNLLSVSKKVTGEKAPTYDSANSVLYMEAIDKLESIYAVDEEDEESAAAAAETTAIVVDVVNDVVNEAVKMISSDKDLSTEDLNNAVEKYKKSVENAISSSNLSDDDAEDVKDAVKEVYDNYYDKCEGLIEEINSSEEKLELADILEKLGF